MTLGPTEPHTATMPHVDVCIGADRSVCPRCLRQWTAHTREQASACVQAGVAYADSFAALLDSHAELAYVIDADADFLAQDLTAPQLTVPVPANATRDTMFQVLTGHLAEVEQRRDDAMARRDVLLRRQADTIRALEHGYTEHPPCMPAEMPDVRLRLLAGWETRGWQLLADQALQRLDAMANQPRDPTALSVSVGWEKQTLRGADLWWVGDEMCDLLYGTIAKVPDDVMVENLTWPSDRGLVVFAKPWRCTDAVTAHHEIRVHAVAWGLSRLPPTGSRGPRECLSLSSYQLLDFGEGLSPGELRMAVEADVLERGRRTHLQTDKQGNVTFSLHGREWVPLGRSDWSFDSPLSKPLVPEAELHRRRSMMVPSAGPLDEEEAAAFVESTVEDRRMIAALWTLLDTRSVAQQVDAPVPRQTRRRSERAGMPPSKVKIVYLRRPEHPDGEHTEHDGEGVRWSHRWMVSAHMRNQPYGPGRKYRKLIMIPPHVKGPAEAPLVLKETVKVWVR